MRFSFLKITRTNVSRETFFSFAFYGEEKILRRCYTKSGFLGEVHYGSDPYWFILSELRHEKGLTQQALGERLGVTNKTISRWETGCYLPDVEMLSLLSREFGVSINELVAGERLIAEDFKKAADENLVTALDHSTFTLKEKQAFFKKKWRREHRSTIILCSVAWVALMVALRMQNVEAPLCGTVGGMLAILYYAVLNNRMMAYAERQLYPLPHEAPSRRSGAP